MRSSSLLRKKIKFFLTPVLIAATFFVIYQLIIFTQLTKELDHKINFNRVHGTHLKQKTFYEPVNMSFTCFHSMQIIPFQYVNDDYCDCLDGTDEPGTSACLNGVFYCTSQKKHLNFPNKLSSSKVMDGVCDCCDGSDEWKIGDDRKALPVRNCPNYCP